MGKRGPATNHTDRAYTEKWKPKPKPAPEAVPAPLGRPMAIPPGSDKERQLRQLWGAGTQIKVIAHELEVSEKVVKNARARLKLKTRRPNLGKGSLFRLQLDAATARLLRQGASRRGSSKADYLRYLLQRDASSS